jgi:anti-sigma-K factor RskA
MVDRETLDRRALAAEYVLDLLDEPARRRLEARLPHDPALRAAVDNARHETAAAGEPGPELWSRIETSLARQAARRRAAWPAPRIVLTRLARRLAVDAWRPALAGAAAGVALTLAVGALMSDHLAGAPVAIVVLESDRVGPVGVVHAYADGEMLFIPLQGLEIPAGAALQLWTFRRNGEPIPIGLLHEAKAISLDIRGMPRRDQPFVISVEPPGGSPTGRPTGVVLVQGEAKPTS